MRDKPWLNAVILLGIIGLIIALTVVFYKSPFSPSNAVVKDFSYQDITGKEGHLYQFENKPVTLHFWATWCVPCREELPKLIDKAYKTPKITYFLISVDQNKADMMAFLTPYQAKLHDNAVIIHDPDMAITQGHFNVDQFPETIILNKDKTVAQHLYGMTNWESIK